MAMRACQPEDEADEKTLMAVVTPRSDYPVAYRPGVRVELLLEEDTGRVIVTRAQRAVKLGYVSGFQTKTIAAELGRGRRITGHIVDVIAGSGATVLRIRVDAVD